MKRLFSALILTTCLSACDVRPGHQRAVEELVLERMRDPSSAILALEFAPVSGDGSVVACGWLNGRNAAGGYAGRRFVYVRGTVDGLSGEAELLEFRQNYKDGSLFLDCVAAGVDGVALGDLPKS